MGLFRYLDTNSDFRRPIDLEDIMNIYGATSFRVSATKDSISIKFQADGLKDIQDGPTGGVTNKTDVAACVLSIPTAMALVNTLVSIIKQHNEKFNITPEQTETKTGDTPVT